MTAATSGKLIKLSAVNYPLTSTSAAFQFLPVANSSHTIIERILLSAEVRVTDAVSPVRKAVSSTAISARWSSLHSILLLTLAALACLLPFSDKAFHMDDPLFVWTAQHIALNPLDPYGFRVVWYATASPVADVTKNPPLASYYAALFGTLFGWSERSMHLAFLLPALAVILGTYHLASRLIYRPLLAAAATLATPGFLVSGTTVMCDMLMLALWVFAIIFWLEGTDSGKHWQLAASALLVAACALTKYFGVALFPLLLSYSLLKKRRLDFSLAYLSIPAVLLALYQYWTRGLYGRGLFSDAVQYASLHNRGHELPLIAKTLVGLAFAGGCFLPALFFAPFLWSRRGIFITSVAAAAAGLAAAKHPAWFQTPRASDHWPAVCVQLAILIAAGVSAVSLAVTGLRKLKAEVAMLSLWLVGTFLFAALANWTINARSILPMIPAAAILITKKLEFSGRVFATPRSVNTATAALLASVGISLWVAWADASLANSARVAAHRLYAEMRTTQAQIYFEGHWGFQYYMQQLGAKPADARLSPFQPGDIVIIPENTTNSFGPPPRFALTETAVSTFSLRGHLATMSQPLGAGFYASVWGPLPFTFGTVPPERYLIARLAPVPDAQSRVPLIFRQR
jgi:4-amino-4-deoxy-L-arabinose transferase-like glycosyltransferase